MYCLALLVYLSALLALIIDLVHIPTMIHRWQLLINCATTTHIFPGLNEAQTLTKQTITIGHSKTVPCFGLVLTGDRQTEDSPPTHVEGKM